MEFNLVGYSLETDEEFEKRIHSQELKKIREENKLKRKEKREKELLEKLKHKYE